MRAKTNTNCKMWIVYCFPGIMMCEKSTSVHIMRDALDVIKHELVCDTNMPTSPTSPTSCQSNQPNQPNQPSQPNHASQANQANHTNHTNQPAELMLVNYSGCTTDAAKLVVAFKAKFAGQIVISETSLANLQVNGLLHHDQPVQIRRLPDQQAQQVKFRKPIELNVLPSTDPAVILAGGFAGQVLEVTRYLPTGVKDVCLFRIV